jgi:hypothetical protein
MVPPFGIPTTKENAVKMIEDPRLLAHKRKVEAERRAAAIARAEQAKQQQHKMNIAAMHKMAPKGGK